MGEPRADTAAMVRDHATVVAIGVLAATLAALAHETVGHSFGCAVAGGRVTLLTSIFFRCSVVAVSADAGGPLGNLVAGAFAICLRRVRAKGWPTLFLILTAALNLLWFSGQLVHDALLVSDDWALLADGGAAPFARALAVLAGVAIYVASVRLLAAWLAGAAAEVRQAVPLAYLAACASAVLAGSLWPFARLDGVVNGLLAIGVAPLGLLVAWAAAPADPRAAPARLARSWPWIAGSALVYAVFALVQGRGLAPAAVEALLH